MIQSKTHSLYISTDNHNKEHHLYLGDMNDDISDHTIYNELRIHSNGALLHVHIQSTGGYVSVCMLITSILNSYYTNTTIGYIENIAYSSAAFIFCSLNKRVVYESSLLLIHTANGTFKGKYQDVRDEYNALSKGFHSYIKKILKPSKKGFITKKEFKRVKAGKEIWLNCKEMCKRGIATHVILDGEEMTSEEYLKLKGY